MKTKSKPAPKKSNPIKDELETLVLKTIELVDGRAKKLQACADSCAMHVKDAATHPRLLADFGLKKEDCTTEVIAKAEKIDRDMAQKIKERIARLTKPTTQEQPPQSKADTKPAKRNNGESRKQVKIFGYSATAILRWMGAHGWNAEDAAVALNTKGAGYVSDVTIRLQLRDGKQGTERYGKPAPITPKQAKELKQASM